MSLKRFSFIAFLGLLGCEPQGATGTGGVNMPEVTGPGGESCGHGLVVSTSDYASTNVALTDFFGVTRSGSFISSSSTAPQLNAALSGDVAVPSQVFTDELVLLDRFPTSVLSFVSFDSAVVRGQLDVGQGFAANPQDYLWLDAHRALVSRYDDNPDPEADELMRGDDVLVIDPTKLTILSSIDLSRARSPGFLARPSALLRVGRSVLLSASGHNASFDDAAEGSVVTLDPEGAVVTEVTALPGLKNCTGMALSPSGRELTVSCSGLVDETDDPAPTTAALVRLAITQDADGAVTLVETARVLGSELERGPLAFSLAYASETDILFGAQGALEGDDAGRPDTVLWLDTKTSKVSVVLESDKKPFTLGDIECVSACELCFVADAGRGVVHRIRTPAGKLGSVSEFTIYDGIGLGPRGLGRF